MKALRILEVKNCKYVLEDKSIIECEARFGDSPYFTEDEWIPHAACATDVEKHCRDIYANALNGDYGAIADWVAPTLSELQLVLRGTRNGLLVDTDWTQTEDVPQATKDKWITYRQELRDLPEGLDTIDKVNNVVWPTQPS